MPASSQIDQAADKADKTIRETEKRLSDLADRAERTVHEGLEAVRAHTKAYAETAGQSIDDAQRYVTERVQERPLTATFAALGVGMLVGFLLAGRNR